MATTTPTITRRSHHDRDANASSKVDVSTPTADYNAMESRRWVTRVLMGGIDDLRAAASASKSQTNAILHVESSESEDEYAKRLSRTVLVNIFADGVRNIASRAFSRPLLVGGLPVEVESWYDAIDWDGRHGDSFFLEVAEEAVANGLTYVLCEYPAVGDPGKYSKKDYERQGLRPYLVHVRANDVIEAKVESGRSRPILSRIRIKGTISRQVGAWGAEEKKTVRVLYRGNPDIHEGSSFMPSYSPVMAPDEFEAAVAASSRWAWFQVWMENDETKEWEVIETAQLVNQVEIPIVPFYAGREKPHFAEPPLLTLAYQQIAHFQKRADIDLCLHVANLPAMLAAGFDPDEVTEDGSADGISEPIVRWGPFRVWFSDDHNAKLEVVEMKGLSIASAMKDIEHLEGHMKIGALDPMVRKATGEEKSTIRLLDEARTMTRIQAWALGWMTAATDIVAIMARWHRIELPKDAKIEIREDVLQGLGNGASLGLLVDLFKAGGVRVETVLEAARRSGALWESFDPKAEAEALADDVMAPPDLGDEIDLDDEDDAPAKDDEDSAKKDKETA